MNFFVWFVQFLKKKSNKSKFLWLALLFKHFSIKIQPNMSEQEKKRQRIYDLLNAETKPKFLCLPYTKQRKKFFYRKKSFLKKRGGVEDWTKKGKECLLTVLSMAVKKGPTISIKKNMLID